MAKYCQRCSTPLKEDEAERIDNAGTSGGGSTIYVCKVLCHRTPAPTSQSGGPW